MPMPTLDKLNGFEIKAVAGTDTSKDGKDGYIILGRREDSRRIEYVTALWYEGDVEWAWGHYTRDQQEALDDFAKRVKWSF